MKSGQGTTEVVAASVERTTIFMQPQPVTVMVEHQSAGAIVDVSDLIWWGGLWLTSVSVMLVIMSGFAAIWVWLFGKSYFSWKEKTTVKMKKIAKKAGRKEAERFFVSVNLKNENLDWPPDNQGE